MQKQQFLKITKFSVIGLGLAYLILLYEIALVGRSNFFMGMLLPLPIFLGSMGVFFAVNVFSFYLIWTNRISGYFILPAVLFIQTILFSDTWFMHWPCPKCPYLQ
jgi:hypothetical protein